MNINVQVSTPNIMPASAAGTNKMATENNLVSDKDASKMTVSGTNDSDILSSDISVSVSGTNTQKASNLNMPESNFLTQLSNMFNSFLSTLTKLIDKITELSAKQPSVNNAAASSSQNMTSSSPPVTKPATSTSNELVSDANRTIESFKDRTQNYFEQSYDGEVSELKMQEAVVMYQLYQKDEEAETIFKEKLEEAKEQGKSGQSAIKVALIETEKSGKIARWESDWVFSLSYRAAQLDDNLKDLKTQNSNSSMPLDLAIQTAERTLLAIATGVEIPVSKKVSNLAD